MNLKARSRLRHLTRDLAAAAAFASMAVSGELPVWAIAIFGGSLLVALTGKRPLSGHGTLSAIALLLSAVGLYLSVAAGRFDLVIAASSFAGLITAQRMLSEPIPATDNQVHLTSLLMVSGGAALSGDLLFGLCLAFFAVSIALSLGLGVIDGGQRDVAEVKVRPALRQIGVGATFAVIGGLLFFALFPRLSWNVAARKMSRGLGGGSAGLSTNIQLGATGGTIKTTARVVARVQLSPDPGKAALDRYFVASRLSSFDGRTWDGPTEAERTRTTLNLTGSKPNLISQTFELLPGYGQPIALALEQPAAFMHATALRSSGATRNAGFSHVKGREVRFGARGNGYTYTAWSVERAPVATEEERTAALALPAKLDPRIGKLAREIVRAETDPAKMAEKLETHLRTKYTYTLDLPGPVDDPLADFLFERKAGHCEFFATALTVMLRTLGVPARVTVGFFGGVRSGDVYVLRAGDAHAWTEALLADGRFARFDATPEEGRRAQSTPLSTLITDAYERVESWWSRAIIDYSLRDQIDFLRTVSSPRDGPGLDAQSKRFSFPSLRRLFATAATGLIVFVLVRLLLGRGKRSSVHDATALLVAIERSLEQARVDKEENEDISVVVKRLRATAHPLADVVDTAARRYLEARFGHRPLMDGELDHHARKLQMKVKAGVWTAASSPSSPQPQPPSQR